MKKIELCNEITFSRMLTRLYHEILEKNPDTEQMVLLGIRTRGAVIAHRLQKILREKEGLEIPCGELDITLHRDDLALGCDAVYHGSVIDFPIEGKIVVLCDDVLYTGRTVRAALSAIQEQGRAKKVQLLVLIDRGHRELPFRADFTGKSVPTAQKERVVVHCKECDGEDGIFLC